MVLNAIGDRFAHVSGSYTMNAGGAHLELIPAQDVKYVERVSMQFVNAGSNLHDVKVYGSCRVGTLGTVGGSDWTQIGDTIVVSGNTSSIKSISPNCQAENLSLNIPNTSSSNSLIGFVKCAAVTNPTGLNLSPSLNE